MMPGTVAFTLPTGIYLDLGAVKYGVSGIHLASMIVHESEHFKRGDHIASNEVEYKGREFYAISAERDFWNQRLKEGKISRDEYKQAMSRVTSIAKAEGVDGWMNAYGIEDIVARHQAGMHWAQAWMPENFAHVSLANDARRRKSPLPRQTLWGVGGTSRSGWEFKISMVNTATIVSMMSLQLSGVLLIAGGGSQFGCGDRKVLIGHTAADFYPEDEVYPFPSCQAERPRRGRHACWRWGERSDRSISPACRVDSYGQLSCWRSNLSRTPTGKFVSVDDDGYNACALRTDQTVVCWGVARNGWPHAPKTAFSRVSVGRQTSPLHWGKEYACGLTNDGHIQCWESGREEFMFGLDGVYTAMEAGDDTVCGLKSSRDVECLASIKHVGERPLPEGPIVAFTLGWNRTGCIVQPDRSARCWTTSLATGRNVVPGRIDRFISLRAGGGGVCAIREDERLQCWGRARTPPAGRFRELSRPDGFGNYCGLAIDGTFYCWGDPTTEVDRSPFESS